MYQGFSFPHCRQRSLAAAGKSAGVNAPSKKVASKDQQGAAVPAPDANAELQSSIKVCEEHENEYKHYEYEWCKILNILWCSHNTEQVRGNLLFSPFYIQVCEMPETVHTIIVRAYIRTHTLVESSRPDISL